MMNLWTVVAVVEGRDVVLGTYAANTSESALAMAEPRARELGVKWTGEPTVEECPACHPVTP